MGQYTDLPGQRVGPPVPERDGPPQLVGQQLEVAVLRQRDVTPQVAALARQRADLTTHTI